MTSSETIDAPDVHPPVSPRPLASRFYRPELDAIRFAAFLGVFLCHAIPTERVRYDAWSWALLGRGMSFATRTMSLGLPLFFFLSAYLIAALFLIEAERDGRIHVGAFYIRRILRIWPLYYLALGLALLFAVTHGTGEQVTALGYYAVFLSNLYLASGLWSTNIAGPLWSISLEEQFYLLLPLSIALVGVKRLGWIGAGLIAVSLATLTVEGLRRVEDMKVWTNVLSHAIFFGTGILCAVLTHGKTITGKTITGRPIMAKPATRLVALLGAVALFMAASKALALWPLAGMPHAPLLVGGYVLAAGACVLLFLAATNLPHAFPKPVLFLGKISFGLYVFHYAFIKLVEAYTVGHATWLALLAIVPTVALASLSYRFVESPFLRLRKRFTVVENRTV